MTRKKIKLERITNEKKRNTTFKNRLESLTKKVEELAALCEVEARFVIHTETENNVVQWLSPEVFRERMDKFLSCPEVERGKKMVFHDKYLEVQLDEVKKNLMKRQNYNKTKEGQKLMNELVKGKPLNEFDSYEIKILNTYKAKRMEVMEMGDEGTNDNDNINNQLIPVVGSNVPVPTDLEIPAPGSGREMMIEETENDDPNNDDGPN